MNTCNQHVCNPTCYKTNVNVSKKLCMYGFPQPLINEIHLLCNTCTKNYVIKITKKCKSGNFFK